MSTCSSFSGWLICFYQKQFHVFQSSATRLLWSVYCTYCKSFVVSGWINVLTVFSSWLILVSCLLSLGKRSFRQIQGNMQVDLIGGVRQVILSTDMRAMTLISLIMCADWVHWTAIVINRVDAPLSVIISIIHFTNLDCFHGELLSHDVHVDN